MREIAVPDRYGHRWVIIRITSVCMFEPTLMLQVRPYRKREELRQLPAAALGFAFPLHPYYNTFSTE